MGELVKLEIQNKDTGSSFKAGFNPKEYTLEKVAPWSEHYNQGMDAPEYEWTCGDAIRIHMELFFDTYEAAKDVRKEYTDKLEELAHVNADKHRPPIAHLSWGTQLQFDCLLYALNVRFIKFKDDGTPVRAVANTTWVEYTPPEEQLQAKPRHSADHFKRRIVKQGDTLSWIAGKEYDDPAKWRYIADANDIDDPMHLTPGSELIIPPIL